MDSKHSIYKVRNYTAIALASVIKENTHEYQGGWYYDNGDKYPVVFVETSGGDGLQIGWHVTPNREPMLEKSPLPNRGPIGGYDGHSNDDRLRRLQHLIHNTPTR